MVNVKDVGAVGDGVADDTAALEAAIDSGAKSIFFPRGTYKIVSPIAPHDSQIWQGEGAARDGDAHRPRHISPRQGIPGAWKGALTPTELRGVESRHAGFQRRAGYCGAQVAGGCGCD